MPRSQNYHILESERIIIDWDLFYVGWVNRWLTGDDLIEYAVEYWSQHQDRESPQLTDLAIADPTNTFKLGLVFDQLMESLGGPPDENSSRWNNALRKWRYCLLRKCQTASGSDRELLECCESVYSDVGYPKDMEDFILYMPPKDGFDPHAHTDKECIERLVRLSSLFMEREETFLVDLGLKEKGSSEIKDEAKHK